MLDGLLAVSPQPGSASRPEEVVPVLERGKRLRPLTGGARSLHRPVLPEDGYDAGVKKPVAVPKKWTVPSGKVWVTSKLQVTRSPCALCLDLAVVSLWVGPPGGLNCCWPESQQAAAFVVAQGLDVHLGPLGQLRETGHAVHGRCGLGGDLEVSQQLPVAGSDGEGEERAAFLLADQQRPHRLGVDVAGQEQPQPGRLGPLHPAQMSEAPLAEVLQAPGVLVGVQGAYDRPIWCWCWAVDRNACLGHGYLHG